jgi:hypothetical protein
MGVTKLKKYDPKMLNPNACGATMSVCITTVEMAECGM